MSNPRVSVSRSVALALLLCADSALPDVTTDRDSVRILQQLPELDVRDEHGNRVSRESLYAQVWVANLIDSQCRKDCSPHADVVRTVRTNLGAAEGLGEVRFISIEVDADNLSSSGLSDIALKPSFSKLFLLIDWEGRIRGYYDTTSVSDVGKLIDDISKVAYERVIYPPGSDNPDWVEKRQRDQLDVAADLDIFSAFSFRNELADSGITFRHTVVNDAAIDYKAVHYDHGNAIAVADVDLDGRLDIYFTTQSGSNQLWRNVGDGQFEDITDRAGLTVDDRIGVAASFADIDNDGDPDLYISNVRVGNMLFENNGDGQFRDITAQSGTGLTAHSSGAVFFDYDRDGLLDLFVANVGIYTTDVVADVSRYSDKGQVASGDQYFVGHKDAFSGHLKPERTENSVLFRNLGGNRFEDVSEKTNLVDSGWSGDATAIDGNGDGWPDLYVLNMQGNDEYYENVGGKRFVRKSREVFPQTPWGSMGIRSFDFDNDGDLDIYVTDMHSDMTRNLGVGEEKQKVQSSQPESFLKSGGNSLFGNAFYRNEGDGRYSEISDKIGAENYWPWGLSSGDLNADGFEDVFIASSMNYPFRYAVNSLLLNNEGRGFIDSEYVLGVEPRKNGATTAPWFELLCSSRDSSHRLCGRTRGRQIIWGALGSRSSAIFDLDDDGDLDIVTLEMNQSPMVLVSNLSERRVLNFLNVKLVGGKANKSGIGAIVRIYAGDDIYTKVQDGKSGYLAQSLYPLYFGLGEHTAVDKIVVTWPGGGTQSIDGDIELNRLLEIRQSN